MSKKEEYYGKKILELPEEFRSVLDRVEAMKARRSHYEAQWRSAILSFIAFVAYGDAPKRQFDIDKAPELQQYVDSRFSGSGFKFTDTRWPMEFAVILRKMATEIPNLPVTEWLIDGEEDQSPSLLWKKVYDQIVYEAEGDYENFELMLGKNVFGTAITWSRMVEGLYIEREMDALGACTEKSNKTIKEFEYSAMDLRHVLIDDGCKKSNLKDADDCVVFEYISAGRAAEMFPKVNFAEKGIVAVPPNQVFQDYDELFGGGNRPLFEVMHYYSVRKDSHRVFINSCPIKETPIEMKARKGRKKLPISIFIDHKIPGSPYGVGECALVKAFREIKNRNRNLIYDVTKKTGKPTIFIDPMSSFSEEKYSWGDDFVRAAPGDIQVMPMQVNLDPALNLDERTDNDVTMVTGVNINDTGQSPSSEKATKTVMRKESQVAAVELGLTFNTNNGFRRLHTINADIIRLHLTSPEFESMTVMTENEKLYRSKVDGNDKFIRESKAGSYIFQYGADDIQYEFLPVLKVGNLAVSKSLRKDIIREDIALLGQFAPDALDPRGIAEVLMDENILPSKILKQDQQQQAPANDPDSLAKQNGAILPPEIEASNKLKNAQQAQLMAENAAAVPPMGAGAPAAGPIPA